MLMKSVGVSWRPLLVVAPDELPVYELPMEAMPVDEAPVEEVPAGEAPVAVLYAGDVLVGAGMGTGAGDE